MRVHCQKKNNPNEILPNSSNVVRSCELSDNASGADIQYHDVERFRPVRDITRLPSIDVGTFVLGQGGARSESATTIEDSLASFLGHSTITSIVQGARQKTNFPTTGYEGQLTPPRYAPP